MNILVVRNDKLGDFITALPTLYVLKKHNPNNRIITLVAPINKELAQACEFIDEVIVDNPKKDAFWLAQQLKRYKIDASLTLFSNTRVAFAQFLARIPIRIAPATKIAQIFYNKRIKQRRSQVKMAEFEYNLELTKALFHDIDLTYPKPLCPFGAKQQRDGFCFHVGFGGSSDANLTLDEYCELIEIVLQKQKKVTLTFGPDEKELLLVMQEKLKDKAVHYYLSQDGIVAFAKYLQQFEYFVSTSTGTYHVASLVGTPTITFFADTPFASAKRWKSVGEEALQTHFMLPLDAKKRVKKFEEIKSFFLAL